MRRKFFRFRLNHICLSVMLIAGSLFSTEPDTTAIAPGLLKNGDIVPAITSLDIEGNIFSLDNLTKSGEYVLISFFTTYCKPCIAEFPFFNQLRTSSEGKLEILLISVGQDERDALKEFQSKHDLGDFIIVCDRFGKIRKQYGVSKKVPVTFLIHPEGNILLAQYTAFPEGKVLEILEPLIADSSLRSE